MSDKFDSMRHSIPLAPLKIAALEGCKDFAEKVNAHLVDYRHTNPTLPKHSAAYTEYLADSYLIDCACPRFGSGEGKGIINSSVRGSDLFILADVTNNSLTYKVCGHVPRQSFSGYQAYHLRNRRKSKAYQRGHAFPLRRTPAQTLRTRISRLRARTAGTG